MFPGFLLSLREGLEAALLLELFWALYEKRNHPELHPAVWAGAISANPGEKE